MGFCGRYATFLRHCCSENDELSAPSSVNVPSAWGVEQREGGQQAALAGTGRADQIDDLAAIDVERQILEDGAV